MDEQWGYVGAKSRQRWLFYAYDSLRKRFHLHSFNPIAKADLLNRIKRGSLIQFISLFVRILILFLYFFEEMSTEHDIIFSQ
ncbi:IS1 family transposase [Escherichia coli]